MELLCHVCDVLLLHVVKKRHLLEGHILLEVLDQLLVLLHEILIFLGKLLFKLVDFGFEFALLFLVDLLLQNFELLDVGVDLGFNSV